ncbi:Lrp/AsnC ligand binding domain-containing protein [Candidatus Hecatella orcuttiae]|uniref:Lrp/AsnC ligand binding domain-containing protein n=1 Tax=Candidatus Hecatella orcuttiae TaxID=1935119 RepID=UPI002867CCD6|nr:Lrp/AsnC ligand binding domain-containing protein [Candidatus Hecatella orcuttiae]
MVSVGIIYILVVTEIGKEGDVSAALEKIKGVTEAKTVYGEFDVVVRLETSTLKELDEIVTALRKVPGIIRTVTLISS